MRHLLAIAIAAVALTLSGCQGGSDFPKVAYKTGQVYNAAQKAANGYMEVAKPPLPVVEKIVGAMDKASPVVTDMLTCAKTIVAAETTGEVPPEASAMGLDSGEFLDAQEDVCKDILSRALLLIGGLNAAVDQS
jgi:hypothetical protein